MMSSFIIYQVRRFDVKGKQYLKTQEKYYVVDSGLRFMLLGYRDANWGHLLENGEEEGASHNVCRARRTNDNTHPLKMKYLRAA